MMKIIINIIIIIINVSKLHNIHVNLKSILLKTFLRVGNEFSPWACEDANRLQRKYPGEFHTFWALQATFLWSADSCCWHRCDR